VVDLQIQVEQQKLLDGMKRFAKQTGQALKEVYKDQMRLASNSLVKAFPPRTMGQGRKAIMTDLSNLFIEQPGSFIESAIAVQGQPTQTIFKTRQGAVYGIDSADYNQSGDHAAMAARHKRFRLPSTGRVTKAGALTRDIGRWKFIQRQVVPAGAVKRYARAKVFKRLGMMKSGWILPRGAGIQTKAARWVFEAQAHVGVRSEYIDRMDTNASGFLQLQNRVPYAGRHVGLVRIEVQKRQRDLKRYAGLRLKKQVEKFNRG